MKQRIARTLAVAALVVPVLTARAEAHAELSATINNGTECKPWHESRYGVEPTAPKDISFANFLWVSMGTKSTNSVLSCPLPILAAPEIETHPYALAMIDGVNIKSAMLCYGRLQSDTLACGKYTYGDGADFPVFVDAPSEVPEDAYTAYVVVVSRLDEKNSIMHVRSFTGWWESAP
jgi:hypothetical protein